MAAEQVWPMEGELRHSLGCQLVDLEIHQTMTEMHVSLNPICCVTFNSFHLV